MASVTPLFQPIVDLVAAEPIGYEVLSRGAPPREAPETMFADARSEGRLWELERSCRLAAVRAIAQLPRALRRCRYFLNVSPDVFEDPRFVEGFTLGALVEHGLDQNSIVIEITEKASINDHSRFERIIRHYVDQGFQFAVDDFGSGHSSLITLMACAPRFIKLDMALVREIHIDPYRQHLVRALVQFAAAVETRLVVEGVETWDELETLVRLGARYAQGFLFGRPAPEPSPLADAALDGLDAVTSIVERKLVDLDETILPLVSRPTTLPARRHVVEELEALFRRSPGLDHVVVLEGTTPVGLVTRADFHANTAGPFGYSLRQKKPAEAVAKEPLKVDLHTPVTTLAQRAMARPAESLYDPVVVVDATSRFVGSVTMKQLLERSVELQLQVAHGANPLTGLPGNRTVQQWIQRCLSEPGFAIVYADLDRFKEYNDRYGFLRGDEMIRLTARVLSGELVSAFDQAHLGHIGGDDFVLVCPMGARVEALERACATFDREREALFSPEDLYRGSFASEDRRGERVETPLVTLSLAVVERAHLPERVHPALLSQLAASLKKKVKEKTARAGRSAFMLERRMPVRAAAPPPLRDASGE